MSDPTASPSLTREQAILIISRLFAAYLLFWVITDITMLPHEVLSVAHYIKATGSVLGANTSLPVTTYTLRFYMLSLMENLLHIALWLLAAGWFYRCGPRIRPSSPPRKLDTRDIMKEYPETRNVLREWGAPAAYPLTNQLLNLLTNPSLPPANSPGISILQNQGGGKVKDIKRGWPTSSDHPSSAGSSVFAGSFDFR
jgi:hypothetical protein